MTFTFRGGGFFWLVVALALSACSDSPEAKKARYLARGDHYYSEKQYREAIIEYRNVLRVEPNNRRAVRRLGFAYWELGEIGPSYSFLQRARELDPQDSDARFKLGKIYLVGHRPDDARREANFLLEKEPGSLDALVLFGESARTPEEVEAAIHKLEGARHTFEDRSQLHFVLGGLYFRKHDLEAAERSYRQALRLEPGLAQAAIALGELYVSKGDPSAAEKEFLVAASLSPPGSRPRLRLIDFYVVSGNRERAKQLLHEMTDAVPNFAQGWRGTAEMALGESRLDDAQTAAAKAVEIDASDIDSRLLLGRVWLAKGDAAGAAREFQKVLQQEPNEARGHYFTALTHLKRGNIQQTKSELAQAVESQPDYGEAVLLLAQLNLQGGFAKPVIDALKSYLAKHPKDEQGHLLLGSAYLANGEPEQAVRSFEHFRELVPDDPRGPHLIGMGLRAQGKIPAAREQFEAALKMKPGFFDPLAQLVSISVAQKDSEKALERVKQEIAKVPTAGVLHFMLGGVHLARSEGAKAEASYLKALELEPSALEPYLALARLYGQTQRWDEALAKIDAAVQVNPKSLWAFMLKGMIHESRGQVAEAEAAYEKVLALDPRFGPAANNLAYLYSEHSGDMERALALAQTAREVMPDDPRASDTLGWILYKRGIYEGALPYLAEGVAKLSDNAEALYHLGMAQYRLQDHAAAKQSLSRALDLDPKLAGADEVRRALEALR